MKKTIGGVLYDTDVAKQIGNFYERGSACSEDYRVDGLYLMEDAGEYFTVENTKYTKIRCGGSEITSCSTKEAIALIESGRYGGEPYGRQGDGWFLRK